MPRSTKKAASDKDPNRLVRQSAGTYRTPDERFEVRHGGVGWFLVDTTSSNEFGQELVRGPFATLDAVREQLPEARRTTLKPLPRQKAARARSRKTEETGPTEPPPPPPSWIDSLPKAEARAMRALVQAVEREGIDDAEELVRSDRESERPLLATRVLEQRLEKLVEAMPAETRDAAREGVRRVAELLSVSGGDQAEPIPGWALVEVGPEPMPANRRIVLRRPRRRS